MKTSASLWTRYVVASIAALGFVGVVSVYAENSAVLPVPRDQEEWWTQRHQQILDRVKQGNVDMLFIGDSINHGWEGAGKATWDKYYGDRNAVNMGYSGDQTQHVLWRFEHGELDGISPKLAMIMIGTNNFQTNTPEEIGEGITAVVNKLREKLPNTKVLLLAIFPREEKPGETRDKLAKASEIASKVADGKNVFYLDIAPFFLDPDGTLPKSIMPDFLHPNEKGYDLWAEAVEPKVSELLGEKKPRGFDAMFNGKDLTGWKGIAEENPEKRNAMNPDELAKAQVAADERMRQHWSAVNGEIAFDGKGDSLSTGRDYEDFDMLVDWKIDKAGDSGIYLRGYPQVQIWDTANPVAGADKGSGGLYNNQQNPKDPLVKADNPVNEWNTFRIRMVGDKVTVYLNDKLVVNNTTLENYWNRGNPILTAGPIYLQNHGNHLWFRNLYIKEIPRGDGWVDLFNGKDLTGWEQIGGDKPVWAVENGILYTTGGEGGGWLSTTKEYGDFELEAEFRVPENGNSGIFIRAPHNGGDPAYQGSEIQVLDDFGPEYAKMNPPLQPWQHCGSIYHTVAPSREVARPAGEWEKMRIRAEGPIVSVTLNGFPIIENADLTKFPDMLKDHPGLTRTSGFIGLQNHSTRLEYRNIRVRELNKPAE